MISLNTVNLPKKMKDLDYSTISKFPIPFKLTIEMTNMYNEQLAHGIILPTRLVPEIEICQHECKINTNNFFLENKGIFIYTEKEVLKLEEHEGRIFFSIVLRPVAARGGGGGRGARAHPIYWRAHPKSGISRTNFCLFTITKF